MKKGEEREREREKKNLPLTVTLTYVGVMEAETPGRGISHPNFYAPFRRSHSTLINYIFYFKLKTDNKCRKLDE